MGELPNSKGKLGKLSQILCRHNPPRATHSVYCVYHTAKSGTPESRYNIATNTVSISEKAFPSSHLRTGGFATYESADSPYYVVVFWTLSQLVLVRKGCNAAFGPYSHSNTIEQAVTCSCVHHSPGHRASGYNLQSVWARSCRSS